MQGGNYLGFGQGGKLNVGWGRKGATWTAPKEQQDVVTMAVDEGGGRRPTKKVVKRGQSLKLDADDREDKDVSRSTLQHLFGTYLYRLLLLSESFCRLGAGSGAGWLRISHTSRGSARSSSFFSPSS